MITSFVLALREGVEAALIISIALGALQRSGRTDLKRSLWAGALAAALLSLLCALILRAVGKQLEGTAEQVYEGITLLLAAGVLTWMVFWMSRQSRNVKAQIESEVNQAASLGGSGAVFLLAFLSVLREGIELALYLVATSIGSGGAQTLLGAFAGLLAAVLLGYMLYTASIRLNLGRFFQLTGILFILFAAGMVGHSIAEFNEAGIIPGIVSPLWNLNPYLNDHSTLGNLLGILFGYHASPSLTQALGYSIYILVIFYFFVKASKIKAG